MNLHNIAGMMNLLHEKLDLANGTEWTAKFGVADEWELVEHRIDEAVF